MEAVEVVGDGVDVVVEAGKVVGDGVEVVVVGVGDSGVVMTVGNDVTFWKLGKEEWSLFEVFRGRV